MKNTPFYEVLAAPKDGRTLKNLEAFFMAKLKPSPNRQQEDSNMLCSETM